MVISFKTQNLDIVTMQTFDPTPKLFNYSSLDFNYDPSADCPAWDEFLNQLWGDDIESKDTLMMYIGLLLVPITKFQKALFIIGLRRTGKGTIIRVTQQLIGKHNYCSPTTDDLSRQFGLQSFIGKTAAFVSDARFENKNISTIAERILNITGEDEMLIDRKYLSAVTTRLLTRLMFVSNHVPRFSDESGAISGRFIYLKLTNSFYGKEDLDLQNKLFQELPGIFNRAVIGLKSLLKQGHFKQPESARGVMESMENLASAVGLFVKECCNIGEGLFTSSDDLWDAWYNWGTAEGMTERAIGTREMFFEKLNALGIPDLVQSRPSDSGKRVRGYLGLELIKNQRPKDTAVQQVLELIKK
jgi:putative DNA primase/helicase